MRNYPRPGIVRAIASTAEFIVGQDTKGRTVLIPGNAPAGIAGAVGDGVTDDTAAVQAAVTEAYTNGTDLYWTGTYLTTESITNLHSVRHHGPGAIKRGSALFYLDPKEGKSNTLHVATTGSATNDGLGTSQSMATCQNAFDALVNYGPMLDGDWTIQLAAGTWSGTDARDQTFSVPSRERVVIKGATAGHPNVPTTIFDGTGGAAYVHGIRISGVGVKATVQDILFDTYTTSNSRIGLVFENEADGWAINVHANDCDWCGIYGFGALHLRVQGGIFDGCRSGIIFNAVGEGTIGYGAASTADGPVVTNSTQSGIYWSRGSQGHVDYCKIEDNPVGLDVDQASRVHAVANDFKRNTIAIRQQATAIVVDGANVFNRGGADANTTNFQRNAYTLEFDEGRFAYSEMLVGTMRATTRHTGTTSPTTVITLDDIAAYRLENLASRIRVKVYGRWVAATAGTTLSILFDGNGSSMAILGAPLSNASFEAECVIREASGGTFRQFARMDMSSAGVRVSNAGITFDPTQAITPTISVTLGDSADDMYIDRVDVFILG